jgi:hypothetical protein
MGRREHSLLTIHYCTKYSDERTMLKERLLYSSTFTGTEKLH